jgi:hypothetical protein
VEQGTECVNNDGLSIFWGGSQRAPHKVDRLESGKKKKMTSRMGTPEKGIPEREKEEIIIITIK